MSYTYFSVRCFISRSFFFWSSLVFVVIEIEVAADAEPEGLAVVGALRALFFFHEARVRLMCFWFSSTLLGLSSPLAPDLLAPLSPRGPLAASDEPPAEELLAYGVSNSASRPEWASEEAMEFFSSDRPGLIRETCDMVARLCSRCSKESRERGGSEALLSA